MAEGKKDPEGKQKGARPEPRPPAGGLPPHVAWAIVAAIVLVLFAPGLFVAGFFTNELVGEEEGGPAPVAQPTPRPTPVAQATPTPPAVVQVSVDDDPAWGPEDAPVTIIEFSDFQCPYCARFFFQTYQQIKQQYEGKVRFVYRDFPLSQIHPYAQKAAEATECADDQGKFWEYHDLLWANQEALDVDSLKRYAADLGLDTAAFDECLDGGKYTSEVQKDYQDGTSYGVTGTPSFFINGVNVTGALPFEDYTGSGGTQQPGFKSLIEEALAEAGASSAVPGQPIGAQVG